MNRTYEDMSKEELITLVTRLTKQHNEWRKKAFDLWAVIDNNATHLLYIANEIYNPFPNEEAERLREENETLRKMDWEYECLWTWLAENTNLLNTIEPLMEEWKKEMIE